MQDLTGQNFSFATDGACAICSEMVGLVDYLKKMLSNLDAPISAIHCILHQKLVCGKTLQLDNVMDVVVNIKNPQPLTGDFFSFLSAIDNEYRELLFPFTIKVVQLLFALRNEIGSFWAVKGKDVPKLTDPKS